MTFSDEDRANLDLVIQELARIGDPLTIDHFRTSRLTQARRTAARIRIYTIGFTLLFLGLTFTVLYARLERYTVGSDALTVAWWSFSLGGLGAVASIFLSLLRLAPQTINAQDEFEVFGRVILGCLFATVLSLTLLSGDIINFFRDLAAAKPPGSLSEGSRALAPFLFGYSISLVLRVLDKIIQAIETTIGAEDRRTTQPTVRGPRRRVVP